MRLKPRCDGLDVLTRGAKLQAELLRSKPAMEVRRRRVLLLFEQRLERGFLLRAARQDQKHALHRQGRWSGALVEFCPRQRMCVALESRQARFVNNLSDAGRREVSLRVRDIRNGKENEYGCDKDEAGFKNVLHGGSGWIKSHVNFAVNYCRADNTHVMPRPLMQTMTDRSIHQGVIRILRDADCIVKRNTGEGSEKRKFKLGNESALFGNGDPTSTLLR